MESHDPLDTAILETAPKAAVEPKVLGTFPFTEDRRRETTIVCEGGLIALAVVKGSPERVLSMCTLSGPERDSWQARTDDLAVTGHKVIACAWRTLDARAWPGGEPDRGFTLAGLLACEDPVREGVMSAVRTCRDAGIHVIMVTGDHPATARAVAHEIGLGGGAPTVIGADALEAQRARGRLHRLLDDNFRSIVRAIVEGRQLFINLKLSFQYLLMVHIPLVIAAAPIPLAGYP